MQAVSSVNAETARDALRAAAAAIAAPSNCSEPLAISLAPDGMPVSESIPVPVSLPIASDSLPMLSEPMAPPTDPLPVQNDQNPESLPIVQSALPMAMPGMSQPLPMTSQSSPPPPISTVTMSTVPDQPTLKSDDIIHVLTRPSEDITHPTEDVPLVEVAEAMVAANEVFNRVKSEKIAEQALCSIRNDQAQYEGLAKEIVGKAIKQKERERANRASAAASRAKVLRYQTELESRLNRMEAERNAYRKQLGVLRTMAEPSNKLQPEDSTQFIKLQELIRKMETANPQFVRSIIAQGEMEKLLGEDAILDSKFDLQSIREDASSTKKRRM